MRNKLIRPISQVAGFMSVVLINCLPLYSQSTNAPLTKDYYHLTDRYEISSGSFSAHLHTSFKPLQRRALAQFAEARLDTAKTNALAKLSKLDFFNLQYVLNDNREWTDKSRTERKPLLNLFYEHTHDLYSLDVPGFNLHIRPMLHLQSGIESNELNTYLNTRGGSR